ncbi:UNVERIFIED_CONTAM: Mitochondrial uncoupling protein 5 [Sesamum latifolium]|uniref:Mitochondrial uncoupling protein 5 n=1 Tax=Sesamum latifolium TaxID=2727402 RepID=A0AAW2X6Q3_9LAMI
MGLKVFVEVAIASIVAGCSTHPLDLIKVRMQLQGEPAVQSLRFHTAAAPLHPLPPSRVGPVSVGLRIIQQDGAAALFSGVSATALRQTFYKTTKLCLYDILKTKWTDPNTNNMPLMRKITAGLIAGGVGAAVGNPADVAMVRMQDDGRLPPAQRRNYKSVVDAITQMSKNEGIGSLWRGSSLTVNRAMLVTASQLASYDQFKEIILERDLMKDGLGTRVTAGIASQFVAAVVSNPVDVIKTRMMNIKVEAGMAAPYSGVVDCVMKTIKAEGQWRFTRDSFPTYQDTDHTLSSAPSHWNNSANCSKISRLHSHSDYDDE